MAKLKGFPDPPPPPTTTERVFAAIEDQYSDPKATAETIGLQAGIGERRVKGVLAEQDTTLRVELFSRRMARAEELLVENKYAIRYVARLCGYRCASTFARRFAEQHQGLSPRAYRVSRGGTKRVGGATGAFRKPAQRARAIEKGLEPPSMSPWRSLAGSWQALYNDWEHDRRRAQLRGEPTVPPPVPNSSSFEGDDPFLDAYVDQLLEDEERWFTE